MCYQLSSLPKAVIVSSHPSIRLHLSFSGLLPSQDFLRHLTLSLSLKRKIIILIKLKIWVLQEIRDGIKNWCRLFFLSVFQSGVNDVVAALQQYQASLVNNLRSQVQVFQQHHGSGLEKDVLAVFDQIEDPFASVSTYRQDDVIKRNFNFVESEVCVLFMYCMLCHTWQQLYYTLVSINTFLKQSSCLGGLTLEMRKIILFLFWNFNQTIFIPSNW